MIECSAGQVRPLSPFAVLLFCLLVVSCREEGRAQPTPITDSGGVMPYEQAAYDVFFYSLDLEVVPEEKAIKGRLTAQARIVHPVGWFVLDLDTVLAVSGVRFAGEHREQPFVRRGGKLWIDLGRTRQPGEEIAVEVSYGGRPRVAQRPPWDGGFVWSTTEDGLPWIGTALQGEGADLWWPCKDYPSDEPDSMALNFTVPAGLVVASNGRLRGVDDLPDGRRTYRWFVSTPINNYAVTLNAAPYEELTVAYESVDGTRVPVSFWALPGSRAGAAKLLPQILRQLAFFEELLGPYPFRAEKYGVAQTPYLGMEHQTIIGYGSDFQDAPAGFDWLHHHELAHEWWGNLVTAADWRDFWLHEGLGTYMQALYAEKLHGAAGYRQEIDTYRRSVTNREPLAPRTSRTSDQVYFLNANETLPNNDIYYKGALVLHTLRYVVGDEAFFRLLRRFAYPTEALERATDGSQCRFVSTEDFHLAAEQASGLDLDWFFDAYVYRAALPHLVVRSSPEGVWLRWQMPSGRPFPIPVEVRRGDVVERHTIPESGLRLPPSDPPLEVDPDGWILRAMVR